MPIQKQEREWNALFFVTEAKETVSKGTVKLLCLFCFNIISI